MMWLFKLAIHKTVGWGVLTDEDASLMASATLSRMLGRGDYRGVGS